MENLNQNVQPIAEKTVKGPKALFWYLTLFFSLGITAFNTGGIWFQYINKWLPQEVTGGIVTTAFNQSALKFNIASLLVATPLFFVFSYLIRKALSRNQLDPKNKIRVWITYVILFLAIAIAVGDLIATVYRVLDGDYTLRFLLKALSILIIVSWIFTYYWLEIRSEKSLAESQVPKTMAIITAAVIAVSFIGSFFIVDSPAVSRARAFDQTRINNLNEIKYAVENHYRQFGVVPDTLDELREQNSYLNLTDPKTQKPYQYNVKSDEEFELCAEFETSNREITDRQDYAYGPGFLHDQGLDCLEFNIPLDLKNEIKPVPVR